MLTQWIKTLEDGRIFVDLNALPRSRRSLRGACSLTIPARTKGWIRCYCEVSTCQVDEFWFRIDTSELPLRLTPSKLHCPLCACQARCFKFEGCTSEDARKVVKSNQMNF